MQVVGDVLSVWGTLLVNAKTPRRATGHSTLKSQRKQGDCPEQYAPMPLKTQQPHINQQSLG